MNFNKHFTHENYSLLFSLFKDKEDNTKFSRAKKPFYDNVVLFNEGVVSFLKEMNRTSGLSSIGYSEGHYTTIQSHWNKLKNGMVDEYENRLGNFFSKLLLVNLRKLENIISENKSSHGNIENELNTSFNNLCELMNKGNFGFDELSDKEYCDNCGQNMCVNFTDWNPSFTTYSQVLNGFVSPQSCVKDEIIELVIDFKTDELLVADWFRINEFTSQVKYGNKPDDISINFSKGREDSTKYSVENFNYISVHVGNTCPNFLYKDNNMVFGYLDEDTEEEIDYDHLGSVCTDLWNVTIIEKKQLINIIAKKVGEETAIDIVTSYLQNNEYETIKIVPGKYKLRFHPKYEDFHNMERDETIPKSMEAFFTLKKIQSNIVNKHKM